ncbi:MAG: hypothetical protein IPL26_20815 [Leptospiraceae bacterium]|nr:hypothetical protein [Leptospiraceae bacterium]
MKYNLKLLENTNELIESIACGIARLKESEQAMGGKPTIMFRPIVVKATMGLSDSERDGGRNIEFGCHHQVQAGLTLHKVID